MHEPCAGSVPPPHAPAPSSDPPAKPPPSLGSIIARYAGGRLYNQALGAVVAFVRPKLLSPDLFGIWTLLKVIPTYSGYAHLGSRTAMRYLIPYHASRGEQERVEAAVDSVFSGSLLLNLLVAAGLLLTAFAWTGQAEVRIGLACMALVVLLQFLQDFYLAVLRARQDFTLVTRVYYLESTAAFVLTLPLLLYLGIYGLYLSVIGTHIVVLVLLRWGRKLGVRLRFEWPMFRDLVRRGFPSLVTSLSVLLITTTDRFVVGSLLDQRSLGCYGIATLVVGFLTNIPGAAREILEPRMMESLTVSAGETLVNEYLLKPFVNTAYLMPFLIGPLVLVLPLAIPVVLPRYAESVVPTQILSCGVYFLTLSFATHAFIFARNWQWPAVAILVGVLVVDVGTSVLLVRRGLGLPGVALASSLAFLLLFLGLLALAATKLESRGREWRRHMIALVVPFPYMCGWILLLQATLPRLVAHRVVSASIGVVVLLAALFALHRWAGRRFPLLKPLTVSSSFAAG